jgi:transmembrane sensor
MNDDKLINYINGKVTSEIEITEVLDWIEASAENQRRYNQLKNLWVATGLHHPTEVEIPAFSYPKRQKIILQKRIINSLLKYAAVFILAFVLGSLSLYFINIKQNSEFSLLYNTVVVPNGERSQILLYDGTKVWLNSGSRFRYPVAFSRNTRDVFIEGEAFFDVARNEKHPFIVNAGRLKVQVFGTRFNVCAYPEDGKYFTTLEEGSVEATNTQNGQQVALIPGEQVVLDCNTNELNNQKVNTDLYTSWKENLLKFDDATFEEVIKKMERWYDIKITVDPSVNTRERYTMTIKTESLREMLSLVSRTTKIKYDIKVNSVVIKKP